MHISSTHGCNLLSFSRSLYIVGRECHIVRYQGHLTLVVFCREGCMRAAPNVPSQGNIGLSRQGFIPSNIEFLLLFSFVCKHMYLVYLLTL